MERADSATQVGPWLAVACLAMLAGLAMGFDVQMGIFAVAAAVAAVLAAWRPLALLCLVLPLSASDLVLTADVGGFTFRFAQVAAVALCASAVGKVGFKQFLLFVWRLPSIHLWGLLWVTMAVTLALGAPNRGKGVGYLAWAMFDVLVLAPAVAFHSQRRRAHALLAWALGCTAISVFGLMQAALSELGVEPPLVTQWIGQRARINALSYEPSYFAFQALIPTAFLLGLITTNRLRRWSGMVTAALVVLVTALVLSTSRSAWIGTALLLGVFGVVMVWRWGSCAVPSVGALRALAVSGAVFIALAGLLPPASFAADQVLAARAVNIQDPSSSRPRLEGVQQAVRLFLKHPVLGVGPGQYGGALLSQPELWAREIPLKDRNPDTLVTFNLYLEVLAETGVVGFSLVIAAVAVIAWRLWRARQRGTRGQWAEALLWPWVLSFGVMYQFNQTLWRTEVWCLMGLAWVATSRPQSAHLRSPHLTS